MKFFLFFLLMGFLVFPQNLVASSASADLPLDSWIYPALDKLAGLGLIESSLQGSLPFSRLEVARQTAEALEKAASSEAPPVAVQLLCRLSKELNSELVEIRALEGNPSKSYFKPIREMRIEHIYQEGTPSSTPPSVTPWINDRQFALNYNNFGIDYKEHHNAQLVFETEVRMGGFFLLNWRPFFEMQESSGDGTINSLQTLNGSVILGLGPIEVSAGRQSLWWGQGRHGTFILTNNAKPLDMVRLTNPAPVLLPSLLKYLGPSKFDFFLSRLEDDRVVPEPYFGGLRVNFKPFPWVEVGISRAAQFSGEGRPEVTFANLRSVFLGETLGGGNKPKDFSNSVGGVDYRFKIPGLWGAEIYGEIGGEDEAGYWLAAKAWQYGLYLPQLEKTRRLSLRLEYAELRWTEFGIGPRGWYRHGTYRSGYTYEGKILGHHVGGGGQDIFAELMAILSEDFTLTLNFDYEERGDFEPVEERHYQPGIKLEWQIHPHLALNLRYAIDRVRNVDFNPGVNRDFHLANLAIVGTW